MIDPNEEAIKDRVTNMLALEKTVEERERELMADERFRSFLQMQKQYQEQIKEFWDRVAEEMIAHGIKQIRGDWGSLTIAERVDFEVDLEILPSKYFKAVPDTKKIRDDYHLEGDPPEGTKPKITRYLTKRIK